MAISTATGRASFAGNGTADTFAFPFRINAAADLRVIVVEDATGEETVLTLTTQYTVPASSIGADAGGSITLVYNAAWAWVDSGNDLVAGYTIVLLPRPALTQLSSYRSQGRYSGPAAEADLDLAREIDIAQQDQLDGALQIPEGEERTSAKRTLPFDRASKFFAFDADKNPIATAGTDGVPASVFGATLIDDANADAALATLGFSVFMRTLVAAATALAARALLGSARNIVFDVKDYGAIGDGVTNDTAAIQSAITACVAAGGGIVSFPAGTYLVSDQGALWSGFRYALRIASISSANVTFRGVGKASSLKMATHNDADSTYDAFLSVSLSTGRVLVEALGFETPAATTTGQGRVAITIGDMGGASGSANSGTLEEIVVERCHFTNVSFGIHGEGAKRVVFRNNIGTFKGGGLYPTYFCEPVNIGSRAGTYESTILIEGNKFANDAVNGDHVCYILGQFKSCIIRGNEWDVINHDALKFASWNQAAHEAGSVIIEDNVDTRSSYHSGDVGGEAVWLLFTCDGGTTGSYRHVAVRNNRVQYAHQLIYSECAFDLFVVDGNVARSCNDIAIHMIKKASLALRGHCVISNNDFDDVNVSDANNISVKIEAFLSASVIGNRCKTTAVNGRFCYHAGIEWITYVGNFSSKTLYNYELTEWSNINSHGNSWDSGIVAKRAIYTAADTTPSVKGATYISIANAGPITITQFDDGEIGQEITIHFADGNTTLSNSNFYMDGGSTKTGTIHDIIKMVKVASTHWKQVSPLVANS